MCNAKMTAITGSRPMNNRCSTKVTGNTVADIQGSKSAAANKPAGISHLPNHKNLYRSIPTTTRLCFHMFTHYHVYTLLYVCKSASPAGVHLDVLPSKRQMMPSIEPMFKHVAELVPVPSEQESAAGVSRPRCQIKWSVQATVVTHL